MFDPEYSGKFNVDTPEKRRAVAMEHHWTALEDFVDGLRCLHGEACAIGGGMETAVFALGRCNVLSRGEEYMLWLHGVQRDAARVEMVRRLQQDGLLRHDFELTLADKKGSES